MEAMLKIAGLEQYKEVEVPRAAEVGDYNCIDRHGGEKLLPGGGGDGGEGCLRGGAYGLLDVRQLTGRDGRVLGGTIESQPQPHQVPQYSDHPCNNIMYLHPYIPRH